MDWSGGSLRSLRAGGRLYWFFLSRRVPPVPLHGVRAWTAVLYHTVFTLALLKHGNAEAEREFVIRGDQVLPAEVEVRDVLELFQLLELSSEVNHAAAANRRVGKGAVLRRSAVGYTTPADAETERQMRLIDERVSKYHGILSHSSSMASISDFSTQLTDSGGVALLFPALNTVQLDAPRSLLEIGGFKDMPLSKPNYLPNVAELSEFRRVLGLFSKELAAAAGVDPNELVGMLYALGRWSDGWIRSHRQALFQFMQRGYAVTVSAATFTQALAGITRCYLMYLELVGADAVGEEEAAAVVRKALARLSYVDADFARLSLWDRGPLKVLLRNGDHVIWDLSALPAIARDALTAIGSLSGTTGDIKGDNFEAEVGEFLRDNGFSMWRCSALLRAGGLVRDVDASFITGDTLWVIECKAYAAGYRVERGDYAALQDRWRTLNRDLAYALSLAEYIRDHHEGQPWELPATVTRIVHCVIVHCVCTPLAEHMYEQGDEYWLSSDVPRVCLPRELVEFARTERPAVAIAVNRRAS